MIPTELAGVKKDLDSRIKECHLSRYRSQLALAAMPAIMLHTSPRVLATAEEIASAVRASYPDFGGTDLEEYDRWLKIQMLNVAHGASRLGGLPDLPPSLEWPRNELGERLPFAFQLDCSALPRASAFRLPASGWLYGFVDNNDRQFPLAHQIVHHMGPVEELRRSPLSVEAELAPDGTGARRLFSVTPVVMASATFSLPQPSDPTVWHLIAKVADEQAEAYDELRRRPRSAVARLLGAAGVDDETPSDFVNRYLHTKDRDWSLLIWLFRSSNMEWLGDQSLQVFIRRSDLEKGRFGDCCVTACP